MAVIHTKILKICSVLLINSILFSSIGWAIDPSISFQSTFALKLFLNIPKAAGNIVDHHKGKSKTVILIEDLHCHYEVQKNIAQIVDHLVKTKKISLIGQEGSSTRVDVSVLKDFPINSIKQTIGEHFLKQGKITGSEFLAATSNYKIRLEGIENQSLYQESLDSVRSFMNAESQGIVYDIKEQLDLLKKKIYSDDLIAYDNHFQSFYNGKTSFLDFIFYLEKLDSALNIGFDLTSLLSDYWKTPGSINQYPVNDQLVKIIHRLDKQIRYRLYKNDDQRQLDRYLIYTEILLKLMNVSADTADLDLYHYNKGLFKSPDFFRFLQKHSRNNLEGLLGELQILEGYCQQADHFYQLADQRSSAFVNNILNKMSKQKQQTAIMISGGFHTDKITENLANKNTSYIVIKPNMTKTDLNNPYFELLTDKRQSPLEQIVAKKSSSIALPCAWNNPNHRQLVIVLNKIYSLRHKGITKKIQIKINQYWEKYKEIDVVLMSKEEFDENKPSLVAGEWFSATIKGREIIIVVMPNSALPKSIKDSSDYTYRSETINDHTLIFYQSPQLAIQGTQIIAEQYMWSLPRIDLAIEQLKQMFGQKIPNNNASANTSDALGQRLDPESLTNQCSKNAYCKMMPESTQTRISARLNALAQLNIVLPNGEERTLLDYLQDKVVRFYQAYYTEATREEILSKCDIILRGSFLYAPWPHDIDIVAYIKGSEDSVTYLDMPHIKLNFPQAAKEALPELEGLSMDVMVIGENSPYWTDELQQKKLNDTGVHLWPSDKQKLKNKELDRLLLVDWSIALAKMLHYRGHYTTALQRLMEGYAFIGPDNTGAKQAHEYLYSLLEENPKQDDHLKPVLVNHIHQLQGYFFIELDDYYKHHHDPDESFYGEFFDGLYGLLLVATYDYYSHDKYTEMVFHLCEFYGAVTQILFKRRYAKYAAELYKRYLPEGGYQNPITDPEAIAALEGELHKARKLFEKISTHDPNDAPMGKFMFDEPWVIKQDVKSSEQSGNEGAIFPWLRTWYVSWKSKHYLAQERSGITFELNDIETQFAQTYARNAWWIEGLFLTGLGFINAWIASLIDPTLSITALAQLGSQSAWILFPPAHLLPKLDGQALTAEEKKNINWAMLLATINLAFSITPAPLWAMIGFGFISHWLMNKVLRIVKDNKRSPQYLNSLTQVLNQGNLNFLLASQYVLGPSIEKQGHVYFRNAVNVIGKIRCRLGWRFSITSEKVVIKQPSARLSDYSIEKQYIVLTIPWYLERLLEVTPEKKALHSIIFRLMASYATKKIEKQLSVQLKVQSELEVTQTKAYRAQPNNAEVSDTVQSDGFDKHISTYLDHIDCIKPYLRSKEPISQAYQLWMENKNFINKQILIEAISDMLEKLSENIEQEKLTQSELDQALEAVNNLYAHSKIFRKQIIGFRNQAPIQAPKSASLKTILRYINLCRLHSEKFYVVYDLFKKVIRPNRSLRRIASDA